MEDDYGSNVHVGLEKSVRFRVSALERFCYKGFLRNLSGTKFFVRFGEVSALEDVRLGEVPLYFTLFKHFFALFYLSLKNCMHALTF